MNEQRQSQRPDPMSTRNTDWYWDVASEGRLSIQKCGGCGKRYHPPRPICPACHSADQVPTPVSGRGTIFSFIRVQYPPPRGFDEPPIIALVDLEEGGVRLITNIIDADMSELSVDAPVVVDFEKSVSGKSLPVFRLASKAGKQRA